MAGRLQSSKHRFQQYKRDLRRLRREAKQRNGQAPSPQPHLGRLPAGDHSPRTRQRSFFQLFAAFWWLLAGFHGRIVFALTTVTLATGIGLVPPYATKIVVDNILLRKPLPEQVTRILPLPSDPYTLLAWVAVGIVVLTCISLTIGMLGRWQATKTSVQIKPAVRRRVFEHAMRLPLHRVYQLKTGGTASILREDTGAIGDLIFSMFYNPWRAVVQLIGSLVILACVDWRLLLGSLVFLPTVYFTHRMWIRRIRPLYRDMHATRQYIDSQTTEAFGGIRVVRSFGRQRSEAGRFIRNDQFRARQEVSVWWWARAVDIAWALLIPAASAGLLWYGGTRVLDGALSVGDLFLFLTYLMMLLDPVATLASSATGFQTSLAGLDRVLDILAEPAEMSSTPDAVTVVPRGSAYDDATSTNGSVGAGGTVPVDGRITLRNVSFIYPGTTAKVLENISLDVQPGELVALVGPSGAGKTTLCNLIARFYDPTEGVIELDGRDLRKIHVDSYRRLLGIVEQEIFLFDGTIADNIAYGRRSTRRPTMDEVIHFAKLANAHEFISSFERGYDSIIGERGVKLSGGQRQRLAIARALLADPRILILDEATSNLDTENERLIQQSLRRLMKGRTSFVIAHRLSTIAHADRIVVMERGRIVEQGTHAELMARNGKYRHMVQLQTEPAHHAAGNGQPTTLESVSSPQLQS